jgi:hypothetical protein
MADIPVVTFPGGKVFADFQVRNNATNAAVYIGDDSAVAHDALDALRAAGTPCALVIRQRIVFEPA